MTPEEIKALITQELNNALGTPQDFDNVSIDLTKPEGMSDVEYQKALAKVFVMALDYRNAYSPSGELTGKPVAGNLDANKMMKLYGLDEIQKTFEAKLKEYNENATKKTTAFDGHVESKTQDINNHIENVSKPAINKFTEEQKNELDTYTGSATTPTAPSTGLIKKLDDHVMNSNKPSLDSYTNDKKNQLDAFTGSDSPTPTGLIKKLSDYEKAIKGEFDTYVDGKITQVETSANNASTSASNASQSATSASESASSASGSASSASTSASNADASKNRAMEWAVKLGAPVEGQEFSAKKHAIDASDSASTATTKASEASTSASKAKTSETNAKASETECARLVGTIDTARIDRIESNLNKEITDRGTAIANESTARSNADTALGSRIDNLSNISLKVDKFPASTSYADAFELLCPVGTPWYSLNDNETPWGFYSKYFNNIPPSTSWERIEGRTLVGSGTVTDENSNKGTFVTGATGGSISIKEKHLPAHSHTRGSMDIKGEIRNLYMITASNGSELNGAFSIYSKGSGKYGSQSSSGDWGHGVTFQASRNWTGSTSAYGTSTPSNYVSPYKAINLWVRIS